ncbi:MAG: hypothetical protein U0491_02880 [Candidatus Saccharimonadales bacterium]
MARKTPLHEGGPFAEISDVMVARTVDLRRAKSVGRILALLRRKTSGLYRTNQPWPNSIAYIWWTIIKARRIGGGAQVRKSGRNKRDSTVVSATKMDDVKVELETAHGFTLLP